MNVYIDAGAYEGDTLDCKKLFNFDADYVIAFEPNPKFFTTLAQKLVDELHNAAVWTEDGIKTFYIDQSDTPLGSTLIPSKAKKLKTERVELHTIDFADFIQDAYERLEITKLLVKMDIEGAEFAVLERLIETGADKLISKLYVEMHPNKVPEYTTTYKDELLSRLNCEVEEWH